MDYDVLIEYAGIDDIQLENMCGACRYTCPLAGCELYGWDYIEMCNL